MAIDLDQFPAEPSNPLEASFLLEAVEDALAEYNLRWITDTATRKLREGVLATLSRKQMDELQRVKLPALRQMSDEFAKRLAEAITAAIDKGVLVS